MIPQQRLAFSGIRSVLMFGILVLAWPAIATDLAGHVVSVHDGDSLTVLVNRKQLKIRLLDIDAPESRQAFGTRSRQSLRDICQGKSVRVASDASDRFGRLLGRVDCAGIDANTEQVRRGMAWVFVRYAAPNSPLYVLEAEARAAKRGLWADHHPLPPWDWRKAKQKAN